jgi:cobalt-zinc-cadmium efflux system outer membrane protein
MHPFLLHLSAAAIVAVGPLAAATAADSAAPPPPTAGGVGPDGARSDGLHAVRGAHAGSATRARSLAEALERARDIAHLGPVERARAVELDARARSTSATFAGPPVVGLELRRNLPPWADLPGLDRSTERGLSELEPTVSVPLWLPGQRDAQQRAIDRDRGRVASTNRLVRLGLAGVVREAAWAREIALREAGVLRERERAAAALAADVARRVAAGELAPVDELVAQDERLAAAAALRDAEAKVGDATARLRSLAGVDAIDELLEAAGADDVPDRHPRVADAAAAVEAARARLDALSAARRDAPRLSASARVGRDAYGRDWGSSVAVGVTLPLDTEARNAPRLATAGVELAEAELALQRARREQALEVERARVALDAAHAARALGSERAGLAARAQAAIDRAFRAGERSLPELLRARARAFEAQRDAELAEARVGLAVARLNQSLGIEP